MIEIIPAIDLIDGNLVRLCKGDYKAMKVYNYDPVDLAKYYWNYGIKRLHIVDLDGAKQGKVVNYRVLEKIVAATNLNIDYGGGIKSDEDLKIVFDAGAKIANIGSMAVTGRKIFENWIRIYGHKKILPGADVKGDKIAINAWQLITNININDFIEYLQSLGIKTIFCTDVDKDGMLLGPAVSLYKKLLKQYKGLNIIASGGVRSLDDIKELDKAGCSAVIIGKAIYEGKIRLDEFVL